MTKRLESLFLAIICGIVRSVILLILDVSASDKGGEFSVKLDFFVLQHLYAMDTAERAYLLVAIDSPGMQLA